MITGLARPRFGRNDMRVTADQVVARTHRQGKKCAEAILRTDRGEAIDLKR